ncbi:MAG: carboxypeptidase-like regulatory domain-containing protein [Myxococcota bacterium]
MTRAVRWGVVGLVGLGACGGSPSKFSANEGDSSTAPADGGSAFQDVGLRIHLIPSRTREDGSDRYRALPETVLWSASPGGSEIALGDVRLATPVLQGGQADAYRVNPSIALLPGADVSVAGTVWLHRPDSLQSYVARTDDEGRFELWAVPDAGYQLQVIPDDPLLPMFSAPWTVTDPTDPIDLDLDAGAPVYGLVTYDGGTPLAGARLHVEDQSGGVSATVETDAFGLYQIRVMPGVWTVVCEGRAAGKDPTLRFADQTVEAGGLYLDVDYPTDLDPSLVEGQIQGADGATVVGTAVRLTATELIGFQGLDASWSTEVFVGRNGYLSAVVPGRYTIDVVPPDAPTGKELSPARLTDVVVGSGAKSLDPIVLPALVEVTGDVQGPSGPIASAVVACQEIGFDGRSWETFTGPQGNFAIDLPSVPVSCVAEGSGTDPQPLASSRKTIDPAIDGSIRFDLAFGQLVTGRVVNGDGEVEPFVVIEVRDAEDRVLGTGFSAQSDGRFAVPIDLIPSR